MSPRYERRQRGGGGALLLLIAAAALVVITLEDAGFVVVTPDLSSPLLSVSV